MLATSRSGERSRRWLQERLWGSRERTNSQASLRRELSNLRPLVNIGDPPLLIVNHEAVALDLKQVVVDIRDPDKVRSEEHTSELQSLMRISYAVFCLKKKN